MNWIRRVVVVAVVVAPAAVFAQDSEAPASDPGADESKEAEESEATEPEPDTAGDPSEVEESVSAQKDKGNLIEEQMAAEPALDEATQVMLEELTKEEVFEELFTVDDFSFTVAVGGGLPSANFGMVPNYQGQVPSYVVDVGAEMKFKMDLELNLTLRYTQDTFLAEPSPTFAAGADGLSGTATATGIMLVMGEVSFEEPLVLGPVGVDLFVLPAIGASQFNLDNPGAGGETNTELGTRNGDWLLGGEVSIGVAISPASNHALQPSVEYRYDLVGMESEVHLGHAIVSGLLLGLPYQVVHAVADNLLDEKPLLRDTVKVLSMAGSMLLQHHYIPQSAHNWPWHDPPGLGYERHVGALRFDF